MHRTAENRCIKGEWQLNFALWQNQNLTFCKNICTSTKIEQQQQQQQQHERQHILDLFFIQDPETYFFGLTTNCASTILEKRR